MTHNRIGLVVIISCIVAALLLVFALLLESPTIARGQETALPPPVLMTATPEATPAYQLYMPYLYKNPGTVTIWPKGE